MKQLLIFKTLRLLFAATLIAANTKAAVDVCLAGSSADTIDLPAGNYVLTIAEER